MNVKEAFAAATAPEDEADALPDAEAAARELAKLSPLAYDQRREEEAKRLGVRAATPVDCDCHHAIRRRAP